MATVVSGTFTGTGTSDPIQSARLAIDLNFGTGTVDVQWQVDGENWTTVESFTADAAKIYEGGPAVNWRLNCSAYTADIAYALRT